MAAHALFPEHIQTESTHTQVTFAYPVALLPWNTKGTSNFDLFKLIHRIAKWGISSSFLRI